MKKCEGENCKRNANFYVTTLIDKWEPSKGGDPVIQYIREPQFLCSSCKFKIKHLHKRYLEITHVPLEEYKVASRKHLERQLLKLADNCYIEPGCPKNLPLIKEVGAGDRIECVGCDYRIGYDCCSLFPPK